MIDKYRNCGTPFRNCGDILTGFFFNSTQANRGDLLESKGTYDIKYFYISVRFFCESCDLATDGQKSILKLQKILSVQSRKI